MTSLGSGPWKVGSACHDHPLNTVLNCIFDTARKFSGILVLDTKYFFISQKLHSFFSNFHVENHLSHAEGENSVQLGGEFRKAKIACNSGGPCNSGWCNSGGGL